MASDLRVLVGFSLKIATAMAIVMKRHDPCQCTRVNAAAASENDSSFRT